MRVFSRPGRRCRSSLVVGVLAVGLVAVAACDGYGRLLPGAAYVAGRAEVLDRSEFREGVRAHKAKYGRHFSVMWPARWPLRLVGKKRVWVVVQLTPEVDLVHIDPPVVEGPPG